jgi:replicative DNA helicase
MILSLEEAKETAKSHLSDYLTSLGINIRTNFQCFNSEAHSNNDKIPSMTFYENSNTCYCHACHKTFDVFDIVGIKTGLSGRDLFDHVYSMYGIEADYSAKGNKEMVKKEIKKETDKSGWTDKTEDFNNWHKNLNKTNYFAERGIKNPEIYERFNLGFNNGYVIIPNSKYSYNARNTDQNCEKKDRYRKNSSANGEQQIFNIECIGKTDKPIFICEGEFDALSIIEAGGEAIALSSTSNKDLYDFLKTHRPKKPFIISLDNDAAGIKGSKEIKEELDKLRIENVIASSAGYVKDANENLLANRDNFIKEIEKANNNPYQYSYRQKCATYGLNDFIRRIELKAGKNCYSTGFKNLDDALQGGLYAGLYVFGAVSSLGKTTFAIQLTDNVARTGHDVLYFSCEMAKEELEAKSVSRISFEKSVSEKHGHTLAQSTMNILNGSFLKKGKAYVEAIQKSLWDYAKYTDNIFFHEGIGTISVNDIEKAIQEHLKVNEGRKPLVVIDYLQILALSPENERLTDKQCMDKTILRLKQISRDFEIPIFVISSFNRQSYTAPVDLSSFKESGAIEYSADVLIGMQFTGMDYQSGDSEKEREKRIRELRSSQEKLAERPGEFQDIELKILKFRNGRKTKVNLELCPMFNYFRTSTKKTVEVKNNENTKYDKLSKL